VQVLQAHDQGPVGGDGLQGLGDLAQHPLPGAAQGPPCHRLPVDGLQQRRHLDQPGGGDPAQQPDHLAVLAAQPGEGVEDRQVGLGRTALLQALAAGHGGPAVASRPAAERLDQRGLADAGLAGHERHLGPAGRGLTEQPGEPFQLQPAPGQLRRGGRPGRRLDRGQELVPAAVDGADQPLLAAAVADRLAGRLHPAGQGRLAHEPAAPDPVQQLGLGDEPAAVADQVGQHLEDLRLQVAGDAAAA
jgi:hypothetical protein